MSPRTNRPRAPDDTLALRGPSKNTAGTEARTEGRPHQDMNELETRDTKTIRPGAGHDGGRPVFRPFPGLANPHLQTLAARALRSRLEPRQRRMRIETDDGDFLDLDLWPVENPRAVCLLLHGLEGSARSGYMTATSRALARHGVLGVGLNFRSCGGEPNRTAGSYHSGRTDDIARSLAWIEGRFPGLPQAAVGFSLGGNALLVHLGRTGETAGLACAAAVSVPFDLAACSDALDRGLGRLYARRFLRSLRAKARAKADRFPDVVPARATVASTMREFDEWLTAPVHGFRGADDYYTRSSSAGYVGDVRVPTLLIQSADDPLVPGPSIPLARIAANPRLRMVLTERGGHVGFLGRGPRDAPDGWLETRLAGFVARGIADGPGARPVGGVNPRA